MKYSEVSNKIKEYINMDDFDFDENYISIKKLRYLIDNKIYEPFNTFYLQNELNASIHYTNTLKKWYARKSNKLFKGRDIYDIYISINENLVTLIFYTIVGNIEIVKYRNDEAFFNNKKFFNSEELDIFNENSSKIIKKIESLEQIYDLYNFKGNITNKTNILGDLGKNLCCYEDGFIKVNIIVNDETHDFKIDYDDKYIINQDCNYLGKGTITDLLNEVKSILESKIKINISHLPYKLQILISNELKEKEDIKTLEKKI